MMRDSEVKRKLKNGETVSLVFLQSTHPGTAEAIALAGVDMIVIDNEHGAFTTEQITNTARAVTALGKAAVVRTTVYDKNALAHLMDTGISGVFVTMIRDASAAQEVINGVKFRLPDGEPGGERGVCFNSRAAHYGMHGMAKEDYFRWCNENTIIMVDVETESAINDLDAILDLEQIDVVHTGMWDLASAYGYPGHAEHPDIAKLNGEAVAHIIERTGICCAYAEYPESVPEVIAKGFRMINLGNEDEILARYFRACQEKIEAHNKSLKK
ncbi:HpcH/HpaI aldolase family protein [Enterocloster asparagiformis]|uniref:HpcH/HpaI aldolase family protein n=1 Tax=Enterocloster asparagiformis TaxID=333367 RepID=UPI000464A717|nr:aldolase/citrate lyase family protein [Enterocloster asparagiformis]